MDETALPLQSLFGLDSAVLVMRGVAGFFRIKLRSSVAGFRGARCLLEHNVKKEHGGEQQVKGAFERM